MATDNLEFRLAREEDAAELVRLINTAFNADHTTQVFLSGRSDNVELANEASIIANIRQPNTAVLAVADLTTGALIGHASVRKKDDTGRVAWFALLAVDIARQNSGLGRRVLAWAEEYARREWGSARMEFNVVNTRAELRAWYERRGYQLTEQTSPFPYSIHGDWQGILREGLCFVYYGKDLGDAPIPSVTSSSVSTTPTPADTEL